MLQVMQITEDNREIGFSEKIQAHKDGTLHRAFSVLIFNSRGEMLLQKRASTKYHSGGKWSNTACGHPLTADIKEEAEARLTEEMGFKATLTPAYSFHYTEKCGDLWENEIDQVFIGEYDGDVFPDPEEVEDYKWMSVEEIQEDMKGNPDDYSKWFQIIMRGTPPRPVV